MSPLVVTVVVVVVVVVAPPKHHLPRPHQTPSNRGSCSCRSNSFRWHCCCIVACTCLNLVRAINFNLVRLSATAGCELRRSSDPPLPTDRNLQCKKYHMQFHVVWLLLKFQVRLTCLSFQVLLSADRTRGHNNANATGNQLFMPVLFFWRSTDIECFMCHTRVWSLHRCGGSISPSCTSFLQTGRAFTDLAPTE